MAPRRRLRCKKFLASFLSIPPSLSFATYITKRGARKTCPVYIYHKKSFFRFCFQRIGKLTLVPERVKMESEKQNFFSKKEGKSEKKKEEK